MSKKKKEKFIDEGYTVANMNVEGLPWFMSEKHVKAKKKLVDLNLSGKERRAMMRGAFLAYMPVFLIILTGFVGAYLLFLLLITNR
ncbi:MAG: hypothetical protein PHZ28_05060 [Candidatus Izemoplasmatales bacterium]|nr:hypothetical protein [Candidatus Izemoplasmatales bacterium]